MKKIIKHKYKIFCFLVAFVFLLFTSKNSFLYVFNDWVDANAFFTVGKGMMNGVVPYKDIFEQKGILLYLIYGIGYLISNYSFHGVFILEVLSFTIFLYYMYKIISMYLNEKYTFLILPILTFIITTSTSFVQGGSCEEFCLPFFGVSLYYFIRHFKEELTSKEIYINGVMAGCILLMKYTMLGFWIGFGLFIFIDLLIKKKTKKAFLFCLKFLIGMFAPFAIALIYLFMTGGINDFFNDYFIINMTSYNPGEKYNIVQRVIRIFRSSYVAIRQNGLIITGLILSSPLFICFIKDRHKLMKIGLISSMVLSYVFIFWGLKVYRYYMLPTIIFTLITIIGIISLIQKYTDKMLYKKYLNVFFVIIFILSAFLSYKKANYGCDIKKSKSDYFQYKYAEYINKYENPTLLNMGFLDVGVYTTSGIIPTTKYFEVQNLDYESYPENLDEMEKYVKNKEIMFIVYASMEKDVDVPSYVTDNYELVYEDKYVFEKENYVAFLYKVKEES
ncbi:MAG: glycosyltransferase family 39 protein [Bacilli bacterium]|nr:glycosyltransferase family 39 protein [Bacilli bacterium]